MAGHPPRALSPPSNNPTKEHAMTTETYTDAQAIDEAVLLLTRKLRRLHSDIYADLMGCLPYGARDALNLADVRADKLRASDQRKGITRVYIDPWTDDELAQRSRRAGA